MDRFYDSGIYFGLGLYDVTGLTSLGEDQDHTTVGLTVGLLGDFPINGRWSVLAEISGHYADLGGTQLFVLADVGVGYRF